MNVMPVVATLVLLALTSVNAQWLHQPTPGLPRLPGGAPDLSAPPPRTADGVPDLSGVWQWRKFYYNVAESLKSTDIQPWARELVRGRMENFAKDDPASFQCLPLGPRLNLYPPLLAKIIQTPAIIVLLSEGLTYRQIFTDGRKLPPDPNPAFMGYSVGHWNGDTLVIESTGFKDFTWLDQAGNPHTEALRVTERVRRPDVGHLEVEETLEDSAVYARPMTLHLAADLVPDTELLEYVCAENERDLPHLIGKASDAASRTVEVPAAVLEQYVGTYDLRSDAIADTPKLVKITMTEGTLFLEGRRLAPLSTTRFHGSSEVEFFTNTQGEVTQMVIQTAGGARVARRVRDAR